MKALNRYDDCDKRALTVLLVQQHEDDGGGVGTSGSWG